MYIIIICRILCRFGWSRVWVVEVSVSVGFPVRTGKPSEIVHVFPANACYVKTYSNICITIDAVFNDTLLRAVHHFLF